MATIVFTRQNKGCCNRDTRNVENNSVFLILRPRSVLERDVVCFEDTDIRIDVVAAVSFSSNSRPE